MDAECYIPGKMKEAGEAEVAREVAGGKDIRT